MRRTGSAAALVSQPMEARDERCLLKLQRDLAAVKLPIVDELGHVPRSPTGTEFLFDVLSQRYECGSTKGVAEPIAPRGAELGYLPPYSPDLNPIEQTFAKLKALFRKAAARSLDLHWTGGSVRAGLSALVAREFGGALHCSAAPVDIARQKSTPTRSP